LQRTIPGRDGLCKFKVAGVHLSTTEKRAGDLLHWKLAIDQQDSAHEQFDYHFSP
jgi:hypothetical protein